MKGYMRNEKVHHSRIKLTNNRIIFERNHTLLPQRAHFDQMKLEWLNSPGNFKIIGRTVHTIIASIIDKLALNGQFMSQNHLFDTINSVAMQIYFSSNLFVNDLLNHVTWRDVQRKCRRRHAGLIHHPHCRWPYNSRILIEL